MNKINSELHNGIRYKRHSFLAHKSMTTGENCALVIYRLQLFTCARFPLNKNVRARIRAHVITPDARREIPGVLPIIRGPGAF